MNNKISPNSSVSSIWPRLSNSMQLMQTLANCLTLRDDSWLLLQLWIPIFLPQNVGPHWHPAPEKLPQWRRAPQRRAPQRRAPLTSCPSALCPTDITPVTSCPTTSCPSDVVPHNLLPQCTLPQWPHAPRHRAPQRQAPQRRAPLTCCPSALGPTDHEEFLLHVALEIARIL